MFVNTDNVNYDAMLPEIREALGGKDDLQHRAQSDDVFGIVNPDAASSSTGEDDGWKEERRIEIAEDNGADELRSTIISIYFSNAFAKNMQCKVHTSQTIC